MTVKELKNKLNTVDDNFEVTIIDVELKNKYVCSEIEGVYLASGENGLFVALRREKKN